MPLTNATWWSLTDGLVASDKEQGGVYELCDAEGEVIYVGSSDNLRRRLGEHVNEYLNDCIKKNATRYRLEYMSNYQAGEKQLCDEHVRIHGKPPRCNHSAPTEL